MTDQLDLSLDRLRRAVEHVTLRKPTHEPEVEDPAAVAPSKPDPAPPGAIHPGAADGEAHSSWTSLIRRLLRR